MPACKVLFVSGYAEDGIAESAAADEEPGVEGLSRKSDAPSRMA